MAGSLNLTREQLALITGGDPRAIKAFEDFFATLNNLGAHASTHEPGGSDPLTVDALPAVGSLRTLGAGANQACAGNDARLSDDRTPTDHAGTHVTGGGDTIADAIAAGNSGLLSGADKTKLDAIPTNVAPLPQTAAGVGQWSFIAPGNGVAAVLQAGGSWAYYGFQNAAAGTVSNAIGGIADGGTTIGAGSAGYFWNVMAWRIA